MSARENEEEARRAEHVDEQGKRARNRTGGPDDACAGERPSGHRIPATDTPVALTPAAVASTDSQVLRDRSVGHR